MCVFGLHFYYSFRRQLKEYIAAGLRFLFTSEWVWAGRAGLCGAVLAKAGQGKSDLGICRVGHSCQARQKNVMRGG